MITSTRNRAESGSVPLSMQPGSSSGERTPAEQGKRMFRKGYRTVSWRASDDNNDSLRYSLSFRQKGSDKWLRLRENMDETQLNFGAGFMY